MAPLLNILQSAHHFRVQRYVNTCLELPACSLQVSDFVTMAHNPYTATEPACQQLL